MKIIIACGGTGGHLFPGVAVAETLTDRGHEVRLLVSEKGVDGAGLALTNGCGRSPITRQTVSAVGWSGSRRLTRFCFRLAMATRECTTLCRDFKPDAVLGMGGFTSAPALMAARWSGLYTLLHESNAVPGKANRWTGKFTDRIAVGMKDCARFFGRRPVAVTGTPIRSRLRGGKIANARKHLGLEEDRLTVLVVGGSQGARPINEMIIGALPELRRWRTETQFVHLAGAADEETVREAYRKYDVTATVMNFCNEMELAYSAADFVIARAGGSTLMEIAAFALPAVLIPFAKATDNHQLHNARVFECAGAAQIVEQHQSRLLPVAIGDFLRDPTKRRRMSSAARSLAVEDAAERLVDLMERGC